MKYQIVSKDRAVLREFEADGGEQIRASAWSIEPGAWGLRDSVGIIRLRQTERIHTPWGAAQSTQIYADGIKRFSCASHGGFRVNRKRHAEMPPALRDAATWAGDDGRFVWYEEDVDWCIVALAFPQFFHPETVTSAETTLRNWRHKDWEKHYGRSLNPGESESKDKETFLEAHKNDYLVLSVVCEGQTSRSGFTVPKGCVLVIAGRGGRTINGQYPADTAEFLMPRAEYKNPDRLVIDESRHQRINPLQQAA